MTHPVDVAVGKAIRQRRWMVGMTQQRLAEQVGVKFQQMQKYETGMNRVSASRLWDIAVALKAPVSFFFEGAGSEAEIPILERDTIDVIGLIGRLRPEQRDSIKRVATVMLGVS